MTATWAGMAVSDNRRLIQGRGRMVANPAYQVFKESMAWALAADPCGIGFPPEARVRVHLTVTLPRRMDISAVVKAALDAIQLTGAITDDNKVDELVVTRAGIAKGRQATIRFTVDPVDPA